MGVKVEYCELNSVVLEKRSQFLIPENAQWCIPWMLYGICQMHKCKFMSEPCQKTMYHTLQCRWWGQCWWHHKREAIFNHLLSVCVFFLVTMRSAAEQKWRWCCGRICWEETEPAVIARDVCWQIKFLNLHPSQCQGPVNNVFVSSTVNPPSRINAHPPCG